MNYIPKKVKDMQSLNDTVKQHNLIAICQSLNPAAEVDMESHFLECYQR